MENKVNIEEVHSHILEIGKCFHNILVKNHIPYYMLGGTMLGAIRHKGFIPWDDDMDFGIPRPYYAQALDCLDKELPSNMRVRRATNGETVYDYSKIEDTNTLILEEANPKAKNGVFIDIFPLDTCNSKWGITSRNWWIKHIMGINIYKYHWPSLAKEQPFALVVRMFPKNVFLKLSYRMLFQKGDYFANYGGFWGPKEIVRKEIFGSPKLYAFADTEFYGVQNADAYLTTLYNNYMELPPKDKRHIHIVYFKKLVK